MFHSDKELFQHIFDEIEFIESETVTSSKDLFLLDKKLQKAFARSIEIIGEAVKNLTPDLIGKYSDINWRNIAGMRDKLIHGYFAVSYTLVWDVAINEIPKLKNQLERIKFENPEIFG